MFLLSGDLRVTDIGAEQNSQWLLPGGIDAESLWAQLAGKDSKTAPLEFLYQLAVKDDGKLNYFYLFSFFLPPETQKVLFVGDNAQKMLGIYNLVVLEEKEKLNESQFPQLQDAGFFTSLYTINTGTGAGTGAVSDRWLKVITPIETPRKPESRGEKDLIGPWEQKFFAIPVLLNLHFKLVGSPSVNVYLNGGGGVHFGQYRNVWRLKYKSNSTFYQVGVEVNKKKQGVYVFLQGRVRFVKFSDMYGKGQVIEYIGNSTEHNYEGDLYNLTYTGRSMTGFFLGPDFDKAIASGRKALLKMNGPSLTLGIKINFF